MTRLLVPSPQMLDNRPLRPDQQALHARLRKLPRHAQQVFLCSRLDGLSYPDIAQLLDVSPDSVTKDMCLALQHCCTDEERRTPVNTAATQWYIKLQSPGTTPSDRIEFRRWLDSTPQHRDSFHAVELRWRLALEPAYALGSTYPYRRSRTGVAKTLWAVGVTLLLVLAEWLRPA